MPDTAARTQQCAKSRPRVGFAGVGWICRNRMMALLDGPHVEMAGLVEPDDAACRAALTKAGWAARYLSLDSLIDSRPDGIVIATPSSLHAQQALRCLEAGIAVYCQKPLGRTASEVRTVIDSARRADRLLGVDMSYRHTAAMQCVRAMVQSGDIGEVHSVDLVFHNAYGPDKPWFYDPALSGGGCLMDLGVHLVDLAMWTLACTGTSRVRGHASAGGRRMREARSQAEDFASASFDMACGAHVRLACSWRLHAGRDAMISAAFYGTRGGVRMRNLGGSFYDFIAERLDGTRREVLIEPPDDWGGRGVVAWATALAGGAGFDPAVRIVGETACVLDRIYEDAGSV